MPTLRIYRDTRGKGRCRTCGAAIEWAELVSGKRMPFDGEIVAVKTEQETDRAVEVIDTDVTSSHFQTCPDAEKWRRR